MPWHPIAKRSVRDRQQSRGARRHIRPGGPSRDGRAHEPRQPLPQLGRLGLRHLEDLVPRRHPDLPDPQDPAPRRLRSDAFSGDGRAVALTHDLLLRVATALPGTRHETLRSAHPRD